MFNNSYIDENGNEVCDNFGNSILVYDGNKIYDVVSGNTVNNIENNIENDIENDIENNIDVSENTKFFYDNSKSSFYYHMYFTPNYIWGKLLNFFECLYRSITSIIKEPVSVVSVKDSNKN